VKIANLVDFSPSAWHTPWTGELPGSFNYAKLVFVAPLQLVAVLNQSERRCLVAHKMLVDTSDATPEKPAWRIRCVPCWQKTDAEDDPNAAWEHFTDIGSAVCDVCHQPIASLPEPPTYCYTVAVQVTMRVELEASSSVEAIQVALGSVKVQGPGVTSWQTEGMDSSIIDIDD
jgi:hypothetical protein